MISEQKSSPLVFLAHPSFAAQRSMPRFAKMLAEGMAARGHQVEIWSPKPYFVRLGGSVSLKKWLGYIDQYLIFPLTVRRKARNCSQDTLFVFTDQALGPWVPLLSKRPHLVHCHDFLALRSALGEIPENPTSWTGRYYQRYIRRGFSKAKNFISVSNKTRDDLHRFLSKAPESSDVVYNGFHQPFHAMDSEDARNRFGQTTGLDLIKGYLLHVGVNVWYKNRAGVLAIYNSWRSKYAERLPLLMVGAPTDELLSKQAESPFGDDIHWLTGVDDESLKLAYAGATVFLFPSLAEGFGWPIAEAMASGCPVITTNEPPMSEVAGKAGFLIPRMPHDSQRVREWADHASTVVNKLVSLTDAERVAIVTAGIENARRFETDRALDQIEQIYLRILGN